jgi:hypothetical protein
MTKHSIAAACTLTLASLALASTSLAGTTAPTKSGKEVKAMKETIKESCITGDIGIDVTSMYIARGISQENQGAILQPYINLSFRVYEGDGALSKVSVDLGFWNSFHSRKTATGGVFGGGGSTTNAWYESDFTAGLSFVFNKNITLSPYYRAYMSPNDAFNTAQNLGLRLAFDDSDLLGAFSLHPYALVQFDVENSSGNGTDSGVYYEVGIAPGMQFGPIALSLPIKAGFGSSNYYANNAGYGYLSVGANAEYKLAFVPECLGDWSAHANATYYNLGSGTSGAGVDAIRDHDHHEVVFGGGLRVAF